MLWAVIAVVLNVPLMAWLAGPMGVDGLALALSVTATLEVFGLVWALRNRLGGLHGTAIARSLARSVAAGVAAALIMLGGLQLSELWAGALLDNAFGRLLVLLVLAGIGAGIYLLVAGALRSPEIGELRRLVAGRFRRRAAGESPS